LNYSTKGNVIKLTQVEDLIKEFDDNFQLKIERIMFELIAEKKEFDRRLSVMGIERD